MSRTSYFTMSLMPLASAEVWRAELGVSAETDLTDHIADVANPHAVTAAQAGAVAGPGTVTDSRPVLFDGTTGLAIKQHSAALGTAAVVNTGTSGATVPLWDAGGTFSALLGWGTFSDTGASNGKRVPATAATIDSSRSIDTTANHQLFYNPNGLVGTITTNASATAYNTSSGRDTKDNIRDIDASDAIAAIKAMSPRIYERKVAPGVEERGFIAEELATVFPEAVSPPTEEVPLWMVDYGKVTPMLWAGLKAAIAKIETLETRIGAVESVRR